ncbi:hypothetical protein IKE79_00295 [Candidatus Saccharibacteria bacterium]|nr:hypothetical protein [Candidatus Saccharibacteria bacterium]
MNKDVIYIEPEDDITDIITKIENSKEKIVALVPPKKAGVFRSIVNIKLITKAGASAEKTIVLVTTDPSIIKLAAATRLPVTKNLQSAPVIPEVDGVEPIESTSTEDIMENGDSSESETASDNAEQAEDEDKEAAESDDDTKENGAGNASEDKDADTDAKSDKKAKKQKSTAKNPLIAWMQNHKKLIIFGGISLVLLIVLLIWMFVIAPAVTVTVGIRTTSANFSENISLTSNLSDENTSEGKFYYEEEKIESKKEVEFTATGKKNVGEKARGEMVVYAYLDAKGAVGIKAGAAFTTGGLTYTANSDVQLVWDGKISNCENPNDEVTSGHFQCLISGKVAVTATGSGESYNIPATPVSDWDNNAGVFSYNATPMTGGTDKTVTIVQQSDVDAALEKIKDTSEATNKEKLFDKISDDSFIVEASFKQTVGDAVSTPAVGEEVGEDGKAKLSVVTTDSVLVLDETKVEEFIAEKAKLADSYKIYSMNDPFVENFAKVDDNNYAGKLKTSFVAGPKVTENDVIDIIKGKGLGTAQHDLKDVTGVSSIRIDTSYPWVMHIPSNPERITVIIDIEE